MNIKDVISKSLGIDSLSESSLRKSIAFYDHSLADNEKRLLNREIALSAIETLKLSRANEKLKDTDIKTSPEETRVLAINHAGPLDVTIEWKTGKDGLLEAEKCHVDSGGDQINVSKVFSNFGEKIALVALSGKKDGEITAEWKRNFLTGNMALSLVPFSEEDQPVQVYNIVDGRHLPAMHGWADELSRETVNNLNREAMAVLEKMSKFSSDNIWMILSAGGPIRYNTKLAYYSSLVKHVKERFQDKVKLLVDFKYASSPEEAMSVLEIPREKPQDIIKPNLEEFIQILTASGLLKPGFSGIENITEEEIKKYAVKLRAKYNLFGVLVSMDKNGIILVLENKMIREKGIKIKAACPTAAGDSLKAGFVYSLSNGGSFEEAVHTGNLFGAGTASMCGTQTVTPEKFREIEALAHSQNVIPEIDTI